MLEHELTSSFHAMKAGIKPILRVASGVIVNPMGFVLIAQRPRGKVAAGKWEFPGGKVEAGESDREALSRELHEELGIQVDEAAPLVEFKYEYPRRTVMVSAWCVTSYTGLLGSREGQKFLWLMPSNVSYLDVLPTVRFIVEAFQASSSKALAGLVVPT